MELHLEHLVSLVKYQDSHELERHEALAHPGLEAAVCAHHQLVLHPLPPGGAHAGLPQPQNSTPAGSTALAALRSDQPSS